MEAMRASHQIAKADPILHREHMSKGVFSHRATHLNANATKKCWNKDMVT